MAMAAAHLLGTPQPALGRLTGASYPAGSTVRWTAAGGHGSFYVMHWGGQAGSLKQVRIPSGQHGPCVYSPVVVL